MKLFAKISALNAHVAAAQLRGQAAAHQGDHVSALMVEYADSISNYGHELDANARGQVRAALTLLADQYDKQEKMQRALHAVK